jgi:hypothetical protein
MKISKAMNGVLPHPKAKRKVRQLGTIVVPTCMDIEEMMDAFAQIRFFPIVGEFSVESHTLTYTGYCKGFIPIPVGDAIPKYNITQHKTFINDGVAYTVKRDTQ